MREDTITMSATEQQRAWVLTRACEGTITLEEAAELLGLSLRHARRLKAALSHEGPKALVHHNRGRPSPNRTDPATAHRVVTLYRTRYGGANVQHFTELLAEREHLGLGVSTVRRILNAAGFRSPRTRRVPAHRRRRERAPQEGLLLQIDGSRHDWLEGRGPMLTLLGAIDDATGMVSAALFREQEDSQGYFLLLEQVVRTQGIPVALYHDRHGIFARSKGRHPHRLTIAEQLTGQVAPTQFGRLLQELGIGSIAAKSPQAKGRIERLWNTFQDRLVTELRLAGARTLAEASRVLAEFLPRYNAQFTVPPASPGSAYRPVPAGLPYEQLFCFKYRRTVAADNTVRLGPHRIQLVADRYRLSYAKARVEIQVRMDGAIAVYHEDRLVTSEPAPPEAPVLRIQGSRVTYSLPAPPPPVRPLPVDVVMKRLHAHTIRDGIMRMPDAPGGHPKPGPNHPWRKGSREQTATNAKHTEDKFTDRLGGQIR
jgi:hypothetical protein